MSKLLEEAIVDAKALKEAALKSAQEAILEKYNPEVKKAIQSLLNEADEMEQDPAMMGMDPLGAPGAPPSTIAPQIPMAATNGTKLCPCPEDNEEMVVDFTTLQQALASIDSESGMTNDMSQPPAAPLTPVEQPMGQTGQAPVSQPEEEPEQEKALQENDVIDEEIQLSEEFINSLFEANDESFFAEDDISINEGNAESENDLDPEDKNRGPLSRFLPTEKEKQRKERGEYISQLERPVTDPRPIKKQNPTQLKETLVLAEKTSILLEQHQKVLKENQALTAKTQRLEKEQSEMTATVRELTKQLEQINVQNARLFYKNQALSSVSLNERQKEKIVEAISRADSVDEVKIIYETLQSAVGSVEKPTKKPQSLSEAVTRNSGFLLRSKEKEEPVANAALDRWQKIAGIKK